MITTTSQLQEALRGYDSCCIIYRIEPKYTEPLPNGAIDPDTFFDDITFANLTVAEIHERMEFQCVGHTMVDHPQLDDDYDFFTISKELYFQLAPIFDIPTTLSTDHAELVNHNTVGKYHSTGRYHSTEEVFKHFRSDKVANLLASDPEPTPQELRELIHDKIKKLC